MIMAEEFERCQNCGEGWFKIEKHVLVEKGSPTSAPMHHKEVDDYVCLRCGRIQYTKTIDTH